MCAWRVGQPTQREANYTARSNIEARPNLSSRQRSRCARSGCARDNRKGTGRHTLAFTGYCRYQLCMVHGVQKGGWRGIVYCAIVVQSYCNSMGNADWEGQEKNDSLVHKSFEVNEYLVKAKPHAEHGLGVLLLCPVVRS